MKKQVKEDGSGMNKSDHFDHRVPYIAESVVYVHE